MGGCVSLGARTAKRRGSSGSNVQIQRLKLSAESALRLSYRTSACAFGIPYVCMSIQVRTHNLSVFSLPRPGLRPQAQRPRQSIDGAFIGKRASRRLVSMHSFQEPGFSSRDQLPDLARVEGKDIYFNPPFHGGPGTVSNEVRKGIR